MKSLFFFQFPVDQKWFAETSVVCWGLSPLSLSFPLSLSLSLIFYLFLPLHPRPTASPEWPVFWVCFWSIYIATYVPKPLINITTIPDFSMKASMWSLWREASGWLREHKNNPQIGRMKVLFEGGSVISWRTLWVQMGTVWRDVSNLTKIQSHHFLRKQINCKTNKIKIDLIIEVGWK